jgi:hypothetical protein
MRAGLVAKSTETHQILVCRFCLERSHYSHLAHRKKRKRQRIDTLIEAHVWLRRQPEEAKWLVTAPMLGFGIGDAINDSADSGALLLAKRLGTDDSET